MAYYHGCQAAADRKPQDANPHDAETQPQLHAHWDRGWREERGRLDQQLASAVRPRGMGQS
jgi:hypothetical protein